MNKCLFTGRLTADPDIMTTATGAMIAKFRMAIDRRFAKDGEQTADFISCTAFNKTAEFIEKYFKKGMKADVETHFQSNSYTDREGNRRTSADFIIDNIEFGESKSARGSGATQNSGFTGSGNMAFMDIPNGIDEEIPF